MQRFKSNTFQTTTMSDDALPEEMIQVFYNYHETLKSVENLLQPYLNLPLDEMYDALTPIEQAKSELITAYAVNALYWSFLTTQGIKLEGHPLKKEMERIQMYMRKVKLVESSLKNERPPTGHNPPTYQTIDKYAADRFIKRNLGKEKSLREKLNEEEDSQET